MPQDIPAGAITQPQGGRGGLASPRHALREKVFTTPLIGIAIYLFVIHSQKLPIAGAAVGLALIGLFMEGKPLRVPPFLVWFGAWLLLGLLSYTWSNFPTDVWEAWVEFSKVWLIVFVAVNAIRTPAQLLAFAITWLGMFALFPVRGTLFNMVYGISTQGRYSWNFSFSNPNDLAAYSLLLLALSVAVLRIAPVRWVRLCAMAGAFVLPVIIFFTQSRGGLLGLALFGMVVFVGEKYKLRIMAAGVVATVLIVVTAPEGVWDRIAGIADVGSSEGRENLDDYSSAEQRFEIWKVAGKLIVDHPIGGVGVGAYPMENALMVRASGGAAGGVGLARGQRDTHSMFLNIAAETGLVGLVLYCGILLSVIGASKRAERQLKHVPGAAADVMALVALRAGFLGFLIAGLFGGLHREPHIYFMMTLIVHYATLLLRANQAAPQRASVPRVTPQLARGVV